MMEVMEETTIIKITCMDDLNSKETNKQIVHLITSLFLEECHRIEYLLEKRNSTKC